MKNHWICKREERLERVREASIQLALEEVRAKEEPHQPKTDKVSIHLKPHKIEPASEPIDFDNQTLTLLCVSQQVRPNKMVEEQLAKQFYTLAEKILDHTHFDGVDKEDAIQECVMLGFEKLHRFNHKKGKAFNFFTTVMLGLLRCIYRKVWNYQELKRRYANHISN